MDKIKTNDISFIEKIRKAAFPDALSETTLRLAVAKNIFSVVALCYYSLYLCLVGGFLGTDLAFLVSGFYGALMISAFLLLYTLVDYGLVIYLEKARNIRFIFGGILFLLFIVIFGIEIGGMTYLQSFLS